ncbi:MAG: hypothetical protein LC667_04215, partial [Thioalkalivibrio sp.]|nr:hypothetical protein [Thioalkalivibrio sp.]
MNTFEQFAAANIDEFPVRGTRDDSEWAGVLNEWLVESGLDSIAVGGSDAAITISATSTIEPASGPPIDVFTVRSVSETTSGRHVAALDFQIFVSSGNLDVFAPAALTSKPTIRVGGNARVSGSTGVESDWLGATSVTQNGSP